MSLLRLTLCLLFAVFIGFVSCKEETDEELPVDEKDVLYVAGSLNGDAVYWKNGEAVVLSNSTTHESEGLDIFIDGDDVYVAGYESTVTGSPRAVYWENDEAHYLAAETNTSFATAVVVSDGDVYVCGYETVSGEQVAKYWKNGVGVQLSEQGTSAVANDILVIDADVYVLGYVLGQFGAGNRVIVWKNGIVNPVTETLGAQGRKFFHDGSSFHIAGTERFSMMGNQIAKYWNSTAGSVTLSDPDYIGTVGDILVLDGDVYICGSETNADGNPVAKYWKNGEEVLLESGTNATANGIYTYKDDIYMLGTESFTIACYWKNGKRFTLTQSQQSGSANAMVIKP